MKTVERAFAEFLSSLELTSKQRDKASKQHIELRTRLQAQLDTTDNFLTGSYARRTALRPLDDIDVFVVLDEDKLALRPLTPNAVLNHVKAAIAKAYPQKTVRRQARSLNIEFSASGIAYDIVPALSRPGGGYRIPDREASSWIASNPKTHRSLGTRANERAGSKLVPLVKAIKHANTRVGKPARSFHLEVLAWKIVTAKPDSWIEGLRTLVRGLSDRIDSPCPDPAGLGPSIEPSVARVRKSKAWLSTLRTQVDKAYTSAQSGQQDRAHAVLEQIFGDPWVR